MFLPPIVDRELRVAARKRGTYRFRLWAALTMVALCFLLLGTAEARTPALLGHQVYNALGVLALAGCLGSGIFLTADCLAEEKREGTLGLLFLTDLKHYEVVLGKLVASSIQAVFGVVAVLPIIAIPLLLGGVTGGEFGRLILVLMLTLFWSLGIGLAVSAVAQAARSAMGGALMVIVLLAGMCPAVWWCQRLTVNSAALDFLLWPSPGYLYLESQENFYSLRSGAASFRFSALLIGGTALLALLMAVLALPRAWQQTSEVGWGGAMVRWLPWGRPRNRARRSEGFAGLPPGESNPIYWLGMRDGRAGRLARRLLWSFGVVWFGLLLYSGIRNRGGPPPFVVSFCLLYGFHLVVKILVAVEACRRMNEDRASGALELLLVTPLKVEALLEGHQRALKDQFRGAARILVCMNLTMIGAVFVFREPLRMGGNDMTIFTELFGGGILMLWADFMALRWAGILGGLTKTKHFRAVLWALAKTMLPGWLGIFLLIFIGRGFRSADAAGFAAGLWFAFCGAMSVGMGVAARNQLYARFRELAAQR